MSYIFAIILSVVIVAVDQLSKYFIASTYTLGESFPIIEGLFNMTYIHNRGAAFGVLQNQRWFFLAITAIVMIICITLLIRRTYGSKWLFWSICVVLGGGMGNMIDRLFRGGNVVDFIEFAFFEFPIFNVADIAVCVGAAMIFLYFLKDLIKDLRGKNDKIKAYSDELLEKMEAEENKSEEK